MAAIQQISDKQLTYKCKDIVWCQSMDLMCVIGQEGVFEIHRLVNQHQKVFSKEDKLSPIISTFHQDGRHFAIAYDNGRVALLPSDSGEMIVSLDLHPAPVSSLLWLNFGSKSMGKEEGWPWEDMHLSKKNKAAFVKTSFILGSEKLTILVSSDTEGTIIFR
eukprot:TRINITY_DN2799_c0_g2_i2.p2 TRINITY_DN2799_c0_g2~~TRINITY_DN2799_c0_g2_i2.p2  ORF type:complete len:162 (-),score=53.90 TRINITY_DN2799_c0_g2_i2:1603-2088(-)